MFNDGNYTLEVDDNGSIQIIDNLVSDSFTQILYIDSLDAYLEHFDIDFDDDIAIREVNTLFDYVPLMDLTNKIVNIKLFIDDEWTHDLPKELPIFDIKCWHLETTNPTLSS